MYQKTLKKFNQYVAVAVVTCFLQNQIIPASFAALSANPADTQNPAAVQTLEQQQAELAQQNAAQSEVPVSSTDFLSSNALTPSDIASTQEDEDSVEEEDSVLNEESEDSSAPVQASPFDKALEYLNQAKGFAVSVVEKITASNLASLASQAWEYGLAVVQGVILLFTSHEENSLSVTAAFGKWLNETASLIMHKQTELNPSLPDYQGAQIQADAKGVDQVTEYVISPDDNGSANVVRYDNYGNHEIVAAGDLIQAIENYYDPAQQSVKTVYEIAKAEETQDPALLELYRSDPPTVFSGLPHLTSFASQSPDGQISNTQNSSSNFTINYNVSASGSFAGTQINWANTSAGYVDLSSLSKYSFEMKRTDTACASTSITCLFVEFKDTANRVAKVRIVNLSTSFVQKDIPKTALLANNPNIDLSQIKEINFIFDSQTPATGTMEINTGGLAFDPTLDPAAGNPDITYAPTDSLGNRPALTGFGGPGQYDEVAVDVLSTTFAQVTTHLYGENAFGGVFLNYDNPSTAGTVETIDFTSVFPTGLVLQLDSPDGIDKVKLEITDKNGKKDVVFLKGITTTGNKYLITSSLFDEADPTQVQSIALVIEKPHNNQHLNIDWGNFAFIPPVSPATGNPDITYAPNDSTGNRPALTGFASSDFSEVNVNVFSETFSQITTTLYNNSSFGGAFLNYDNPSTTGTVETIDFSSVFPTGLVLQLDSPDGISAVVIDVTDNTGKHDKVRLTGIDTFGQKYKVLGSLFDEIDITKIQSIALVVEGKAVGKHLNVDWGNFYYIPSVTPATGNPDITYTPTDSNGNRPALTAFARTGSGIYDEASVNVLSTTFAQVTTNLYDKGSFGGVFLNYDDPSTTGTVETFDFSSVFPDGLVLQLDSPDGITSVTLDLTDNTGKHDKVKISGIDTFGQKYKIVGGLFNEIDVTKIQSMALVIEGQAVGKHLNIDWGNFAFIPPVSPATGNPDITFVPNDSTGNRPALTGFASQDFSDASVNVLSETFAQIALNQYNKTSFGGAFLNYDNPSTTGTVETINFSSLFPDGLVLQLDSPDGITSVEIDLTDNTGKHDKIVLTGIDTFGQKYKVLSSLFDEIDITKIQSIALVVEGKAVGKHLNVDWGNFYFIPPVSPATGNPDITFVPNDSTGNRPALTGFASQDFSDVSVSLASPTFATLTLNQYNKSSFGGAFINYDDASTTSTIETINFSSLFPDGLVLQLDSPDGVTSVTLDLTDNTGKHDKVVLTGIDTFGQKYKILGSLFNEIDITKIQSMALVIEGKAVGKHLNVDWGLFAFTPTINPASGNPATTPAPVDHNGNRLTFTGFASNDFSDASVSATSASAGSIGFNLYNAASFGGAFINYDDASTTGTTESIDFTSVFSSGLVLGLSSPNGLTTAILEFTDASGKKYQVKLAGLTSSEQRYKILNSDLDGALIDSTHIVSIALLETGKNIGKTLTYNWGNFAFTPTINSDPTNPATTLVPTNSLGYRPVLTGFASADFSDSTVTMTSATAGSIAMNLYNAASFGGAFFSYDDAATTGTIESIDFTSAFASGLVLGLSSPDGLTTAILEFTDVNGKKYQVKLAGLTSSEQRYKIVSSDINTGVIDITKITSIAILETGKNIGKSLVFNWGKFAFVPSFSPDAGNPSITQLPTTSTGALVELTPFATDGSSVETNITSESQATLTFNLAGPQAFGGVAINYDNPATTGTVETIDLTSVFSGGMVLELDNNGTALSSIYIEVTDINGKRDRVRLTDIVDQAKRWNIPITAFDEVDTTQITTISFVMEGGPVTGLELDVNWGNWQAPI